MNLPAIMLSSRFRRALPRHLRRDKAGGQGPGGCRLAGPNCATFRRQAALW
jgi:hypothetical protein